MYGAHYIAPNGYPTTEYFPKVWSSLPITYPDDSVASIHWGRAKEEQGKNRLPVGGTAPFNLVKDGYWGQYPVVPVQIPVKKFMVNDQWFDLKPGDGLQGVVLEYSEYKHSESRVYVVTVQRRPRIIPLKKYTPQASLFDLAV